MLSGCAFNFELTSQRSALENQIMGKYEELDDDLIVAKPQKPLTAGSLAKKMEHSELEKLAMLAKQNQEFNLDDIEELKDEQILGETTNGYLRLLAADIGLAKSASKEQKSLAEALVAEENHDREIIWRRAIDTDAALSDKDLPKIQRKFAEKLYAEAPAGYWFEASNKQWQQKK